MAQYWQAIEKASVWFTRLDRRQTCDTHARKTDAPNLRWRTFDKCRWTFAWSIDRPGNPAEIRDTIRVFRFLCTTCFVSEKLCLRRSKWPRHFLSYCSPWWFAIRSKGRTFAARWLTKVEDEALQEDITFHEWSLLYQLTIYKSKVKWTEVETSGDWFCMNENRQMKSGKRNRWGTQWIEAELWLVFLTQFGERVPEKCTIWKTIRKNDVKNGRGKSDGHETDRTTQQTNEKAWSKSLGESIERTATLGFD